MQDLTIAVVGATGAVGAEFLRIVETRYPNLPNLKLMTGKLVTGLMKSHMQEYRLYWPSVQVLLVLISEIN